MITDRSRPAGVLEPVLGDGESLYTELLRLLAQPWYSADAVQETVLGMYVEVGEHGRGGDQFLQTRREVKAEKTD